MGLFSYNCRGCGHPLLARHATDEGINEWMREGVAIFKNGDRISGEYDGYGRLDGYCEIDRAACWHRACWELAGKPEFDQASTSANDQGHFFDDGAHDMLDPLRTRFMAPEVVAEELAQAQARREVRRQHQREIDAVKNAITTQEWKVMEADGKEAYEAINALRDGFRAFVRGQPESYDVAPEAAPIFHEWFDAMKAQAQVEWLVAHGVPVPHYIPGKSEAAW